MQDRPKTASNLFTPVALGPLTLPNRIAMAPLTRSRAAAGNVPTQLNALYYAQRASAGLIISEATQVAPEGQGYISTPEIHSAKQVQGWVRDGRVSPAARASSSGSGMWCVSHKSFQPGGAHRWRLPIRPNGQA
jgi:N-ethylmaleimide reductase